MRPDELKHCEAAVACLCQTATKAWGTASAIAFHPLRRSASRPRVLAFLCRLVDFGPPPPILSPCAQVCPRARRNLVLPCIADPQMLGFLHDGHSAE